MSLSDNIGHSLLIHNIYNRILIPVKKAYHKLSLQVHPDRVNDDEKIEATEKFKVLGGVHSILSDSDKRALYDENGTVDDEEKIVERDWSVYWRILFKKITDEDISNYEKEYIGWLFKTVICLIIKVV